MGDLRESKKRETRQRLSDVATKLFFERGFEAVTIEEIAAAARVSKPTVFNYFARKEDLFLDREDDVERLMHAALDGRPKGQSVVDAFRALAERLAAEKHPFARIDAETVGWWRVVAASPSLRSRVREIGDESVLRLATRIGGAEPEGTARLLAGMIVLAWRTAYADGVRVWDETGSAKKAKAAFLALLERGLAAAADLPTR